MMESFKQVRRPWTKEEDTKLLSFVEKYKSDLHAHWTDIAKLTDGRNSKQCRDRYLHHLAEGTDKTPYLPSEERALFALQAELGNKWAEIARRLPGRTESSVKNRYYSALRRVQRACGGDADEAAALLSTFAQMQVVRLGVSTGGRAAHGGGPGAGLPGDAPAYDAGGKRLQFEDEVLKSMEKEGKGVTGPGEESRAIRVRLLSSWRSVVGPAGLSLATSLLPGGAGEQSGAGAAPLSVPRLPLSRFTGTADEEGEGINEGVSSRSAVKVARRAGGERKAVAEDGRTTARTAGSTSRRGKTSARAGTPPSLAKSLESSPGLGVMDVHGPLSSASAPSIPRPVLHAVWDPTARALSPATSVEGELGMDAAAVGESTLELPAFPQFGMAGQGVGGRGSGKLTKRYLQESPQAVWNSSETSTGPLTSLPSGRSNGAWLPAGAVAPITRPPSAAGDQPYTPGRRSGKSKLPTLDRIIAVPVPVRPGKDGIPVPIPQGAAGQGASYGQAVGVVMVPTVMARRQTAVKRHRQPSLDSSDYSSSYYSGDDGESSSSDEQQAAATPHPYGQSQGQVYGSATRLVTGIWGPVAAPRAATPPGFALPGPGRGISLDSFQHGTPLRQAGGGPELSPYGVSTAGNSRSASALAGLLGSTGLDTPVRLTSASRYAAGSPMDLLQASSLSLGPQAGAGTGHALSLAAPAPVATGHKGYALMAGGLARTLALPSPPVLTPLRPQELPFRLAPHPAVTVGMGGEELMHGSGPSSHSGSTAVSPVHEEPRLLQDISLVATVPREGQADKPSLLGMTKQAGVYVACTEASAGEGEGEERQPLLQMLAAAAGFD